MGGLSFDVDGGRLVLLSWRTISGSVDEIKSRNTRMRGKRCCRLAQIAKRSI
jgi:hypothetical protein